MRRFGLCHAGRAGARPYRVLGYAAPVARERDPTALWAVARRPRGSATLPRFGVCHAGRAGARPCSALGCAAPVARERDPTALWVVPRRSRGSATLPRFGVCHAGRAGARPYQRRLIKSAIRGLFARSQPMRFRIALQTVSSTLTRAYRLQLDSTIVQGAYGVLVRNNISSTASRY